MKQNMTRRMDEKGKTAIGKQATISFGNCPHYFADAVGYGTSITVDEAIDRTKKSLKGFYDSI